ncbi:protein kinase domain-containing protein [Nannocystis pusilla]|uniref:protein kinase domain-containing protein n=1 Tax=Nannocystis pusilla TaxID=889268 RepID=UPI003B817171
MFERIEALHPHYDPELRLLTLTLDHGKANEVGTVTLDAFEALCELLEHGEVACLCTTSRRTSKSGTPIFISGADVTERVGWADERVKAHVRRQRSILQRLRHVPLFTVALSHGVTLGWGLEFLLTADYCLSTPAGRFGLPETGLGIIPGARGTAELALAVGPAHALRLGCTGEEIGADEALRIGLCHEIVPDIDAGLARVRTFAELLRRRSPPLSRCSSVACWGPPGRPKRSACASRRPRTNAVSTPVRPRSGALRSARFARAKCHRGVPAGLERRCPKTRRPANISIDTSLGRCCGILVPRVRPVPGGGTGPLSAHRERLIAPSISRHEPVRRAAIEAHGGRGGAADAGQDRGALSGPRAAGARRFRRRLRGLRRTGGAPGGAQADPPRRQPRRARLALQRGRAGQHRPADGGRRELERAPGRRRPATPITRSFGATQGAVSDDIAEFKAEFRLLTQLHHPNLAAVYDFGRCEDGGVYFTQELLAGVSLQECLRTAPRETIVELFVQLARALDYIHAVGFVHGDIKPSNVIVCQPESEGGQPQAKLIDFGLARLFRHHRKLKDLALDQLDENEELIKVRGTPGFSAPEKVRGEVIDSRADIYSLAATIYTAVRGVRPFPSRTFKEALRNAIDWRPELAGALLQQCGPVVAELVGRMLSPDPELRPQSARSIVLELLRRESSHIRDRQKSAQDRREFARVLVELLPFVDRADYLDILLLRAHDVLRPDSARNRGSRVIRTVIVEAPEGMGKTRLLNELRREIQLGDGLFVEGSCWTGDGEGLGPFAPVVLQLATALGERSEAVRKYPDLIRAARDRSHESAAAAQLTEFLVRCAAEHPYVLYLSDLARGTETTRVLVEQLTRAFDHNEARALLCITTEPHPKFRPQLVALSREQLVELWNLRPFTQKEMMDVLKGILGDAPALRELVTMLDKLTGGHPLSFRETLRVLIEESILVRDNDTWVLRSASAAAEQLHKTLAQRSEARLDALGVSAWEVASILYLIEAPIDEERLAHLTDLRRERFRRTLERLEGEGLILRSAITGASQVVLAHASVREAVRIRYEDSLSETRLELAERIAEQTTVDPQFVFLRARLLDAAADGLEYLSELEKAAEDLFATGQPNLAAQVLERVIIRLRKFGRVQGLPRLLRAQLNLVERAPARSTTRAARPRSTRPASSSPSCWVTIGPRRSSGSASSTATPSTAAPTPRWRSVACRTPRSRPSRRATGSSSCGSPTAAPRSCSARARSTARSAARRRRWRSSTSPTRRITTSATSWAPACAASLAGQLAEARRLHDQAKPLASRVSVLQRQAYISGIAYLAVLGNEPERAIPETRAALEQLRAAGVTRMLINPLHNLGDLLLRSGDFEGASESFREALRFAGLHGFAYHLHLNRGFLGYTLARMGEVEEGAAMLAEARRGIQTIQNEQFAHHQLRLLDAEVAHMLGQSPRRAASSKRCSPISTRPMSSASRSGLRRRSAASSATAARASSRPPTRPTRRPSPRPGHRADQAPALTPAQCSAPRAPGLISASRPSGPALMSVLPRALEATS